MISMTILTIHFLYSVKKKERKKSEAQNKNPFFPLKIMQENEIYSTAQSRPRARDKLLFRNY
jgi:hypothetical protein